MHDVGVSSSPQQPAAPASWGGSPALRRTFTETLDGAPFAVTVTVAVTDRGPRVVEVMVTATPGGPPVSGTVLRGVRVADLARQVVDELDTSDAVALATGGQFVSPVPVGAPQLTDEDRERIRDAGPTAENLRIVAAVYNEAALLGRPPARAVELALGLPRVRASRWVRRARARGLIFTRETVAELAREAEEEYGDG